MNDMKVAHKNKQEQVKEIIGQHIRCYSSAMVLFHHAVAERLGLGPTDHKCLDFLRERGTLTGSDLAAITGLTTGAITGVVARLEKAGYVHRTPDPHDGRKQILSPVQEKIQNIHAVLSPLRKDMGELLESFDDKQLSVVTSFLNRSTDLLHRHVALLRSGTLHQKPDVT